MSAVSAVLPAHAFWRGRRVFITGHTGFKGGWLTLWLQRMGAEVTGFALPPATTPNLFTLARIGEDMDFRIGDVRDAVALADAMRTARPEIVFHLAAQALVRAGYQAPVETYATNVMGTVHLLEAVRQTPSVRAVVIVTSDKCYDNREWLWGYREIEPLGGADPYSSSKACAELVTGAYRNAYFPPERYAEHGVAIASARAGNVIGGGDWAADRLVPDILRAIAAGEPARIRHPDAIRPWQHVLEPLAGYLILAERLTESGPAYAEAWNFGPAEDDAKPVRWIVERFTQAFGEAASWQPDTAPQPHEAHALKLDSAKARARLGWRPRWNLTQALDAVVAWQCAYAAGEDLREVCGRQIDAYCQQDQGYRR